MAFAITAYFSTYAIVLSKNICLYENDAVQAVSIEFPPHITEWMTLTIPNAFSLIRKVAGLLSYKLPFHT